MIFNEIKCRVNTSLGLVGGMHPPCVRACMTDYCRNAYKCKTKLHKSIETYML